MTQSAAPTATHKSDPAVEADTVQRIRSAHQCGLQEAKRIAQRRTFESPIDAVYYTNRTDNLVVEMLRVLADNAFGPLVPLLAEECEE